MALDPTSGKLYTDGMKHISGMCKSEEDQTLVKRIAPVENKHTQKQLTSFFPSVELKDKSTDDLEAKIASLTQNLNALKRSANPVDGKANTGASNKRQKFEPKA